MSSHQTSRVRPNDDTGHRNKSEPMVPLAFLLSRELMNEKVGKPVIRYGVASQPKKGEDFCFVKMDCQRIPGDRFSTFSVFAVLDGHNGAAAAIYTKDNLLNNVISAIPPGLSHDEWIAVLPRALVAGFVKTDKDFQRKEQTSGTTATFVIVDGWTVTVACVGDSRCILDVQGGSIAVLTVDHRLEDNEEERERVRASGGEVGRLNIVGGIEVVCVFQGSIGDMDVGEFIVPIPFVKQIKLSKAGGRLIIASDGVWDSLTCEKTANCCRGLPAELAAKQVVKETLRVRGLRDDTSCIIADIIPPDNSVAPPLVVKKQNIFKSWFFGKKSRVSTTKNGEQHTDFGIIEELFEEGSAMLAERLGSDCPAQVDLMLFICAVCQIDIAPSEGISVHAGSFFSIGTKPWEGPFLCFEL